jgi:hypothetical protein
MGWTTWNLQDVHIPKYQGAWMNEQHVREQADLMHRLLQPHGYNYVNIDSGWCGGYDNYGRPIPDYKKFPSGIAGLAADFHKRGQKIGIYWIPGVQKSVYDLNPPIYGTHYHIRDIVATPHVAGNAFGDWHMKIDFTKPGAQEFIDSIASLWASWGIDYLKIDGVGPGSDSDVDSRPDIKAYSIAFQKTGRPVWLEVSWRLDHAEVGFWQRYANGRRVNDDVDSLTEKITGWGQVLKRFVEAPLWSEDAGPSKGWNDFDSIPVGNGAMDGLTDDERRSVMTLWAVECAPLYNGDDLSKLDDLGLKLLTNDEVIAVDQAGHPAVQMVGGSRQVWRADNGDGTVTVALFNLGGERATLSADWSFLGLSGSQPVRDLWSGTDLGDFQGKFDAPLDPHACRLIRIGHPNPAAARAPLAISGLRPSAGAGSVTLTWKASPGAKRYAVWRSVSPQSGYTLLSAGVRKPRYVDKAVTAETPYFYQVAPIDDSGSGARSQPVNAIPTEGPHSGVISVDFVGDTVSMDASETAGVIPAMNWNCAPCRYGRIALTDASGSATGASLFYDAGGTWAVAGPDRPGDYRMMKGYLETYGHDTTKVTVAGLPKWIAANGYDVYVYADGGNGEIVRAAKYGIGGQSYTITDAAHSDYGGAYSASPSAATYVKFSNVTGDSFTLAATPVSSTDPNLRAPINGIQIVARRPEK